MKRRTTKKSRRFPVWMRIAVAIGLIIFGIQQYGYWRIPPSARAAGAALRGSAAYADPSEPDVIDVARARQLIGDRPVLVAVLPAHYPKRELAACDDVAKLHPENLVLAYVGAQRPAFCAGSKFPHPTTPGVDVDDWVFQVLLSTTFSSDYRVAADAHHRTAEVEEFVLAFDAQVQKDYSNGIPNRQADPDPLVWWRVMLELAGLVLLAVAIFAAVRLTAKRIITLRAERAALRTRRLDLEQELSQAAAEVMRHEPSESTETARARAQLAEQYLHALTAFEAASTQRDLDTVEPMAAALVKLAHRLGAGKQTSVRKRAHR